MKRAIRLYVLVTQFIFTMILLGLIGAWFGEEYGPEKTGQSLFAGIGLLLSLFINLIFLFQFLRNEKYHENDKD